MASDIRSKRTKQNIRKRQLKWYRVYIIIGVVVLIAAIIVLSFFFGRTSSNTIFTNKNSLPFNNDTLYDSNDDLIVYQNGTSLIGIDEDLKEEFTVSGLSNEHKFHISDENLVAFNEKTYSVYSMDSKPKELAKYETGGSIIDARIEGEYVAFHLLENEVNKLKINHIETGEVFSADIDSTDYLLDFGILPASNNLWSLTMNNSITTNVTTFTTYNTTRNSISSVINMADQLLDEFHINGELAYGIGTDNIVEYELSGQKLSTNIVYGWEMSSLVFNGAEPTYALTPRGNDKFRYVRIMESDGTQYSFSLQQECFSIIMGKEYVYSFNDKTIYRTDSKGKETMSVDAPFKIDEATGVLDNTHAIVANGNSLMLLELR